MVRGSSSDDDGSGIFIAANTLHTSGLTFTNAVAGGRGMAIFVAGSVSGLDITNVASINYYSESLGAFLYVHTNIVVALDNLTSIGDTAK